MSLHQIGRLFDLAPDGLGFIEPEISSVAIAFHLRQLGLRSFEEAGLREGMLVTFHLNDQHQVDCVTPEELATRKPRQTTASRA